MSDQGKLEPEPKPEPQLFAPALPSPTRFERAVEIVLKLEGGHTVDAGGDTHFGIARRFHPNEQPWPPTRERAIDIYRVEYWDFYRCDKFPAPLDTALFDGVVNQTGQWVVKQMQLALGFRGDAVDGLVGPKMISSAWRRGASLYEVLDMFLAYRALRYAENKDSPLGLEARLFRLQRAILLDGLTS